MGRAAIRQRPAISLTRKVRHRQVQHGESRPQEVPLTGGRIGRKVLLGALSRGHEIASVEVRLAGILLEVFTSGSRPGATGTTSSRNSRGHGLPTTTTSNPSQATPRHATPYQCHFSVQQTPLAGLPCALNVTQTGYGRLPVGSSNQLRFCQSRARSGGRGSASHECSVRCLCPR